MKLRRLSASLFILTSLFTIYHSAPAAEGSQGKPTPPHHPNFVVIMADDLGYAELGCYGSKTFKTPHIDALAEGGLRLTDFHSNGAVCSPTRAALLTGRYQQRSGIDGVVTAKSHRHTGLGLEQETVAEMLKRAGYATGMVGKKLWTLTLTAGAHRVGIAFACQRCGSKSVPNLNALDRINAHHRMGKFSIQLGIERRAPACGNAGRHAFHHRAQ